MQFGTLATRISKSWWRLLGVVALVTVTVSTAELLGAGAAENATSRPVGIMSCAQAIVVKPASFVISCADGNSYLQKIKWSSWSSTSAKGTATYTQNNCTPYCAAGKFINYRARLSLSVVKSTKSGKLFTKLFVSYVSGNKTKSFTFALLT